MATDHSPSAEVPLHYEHRGAIRATPAALFAHLDDHTRLSGHMEKPSWRTLGAYMRIQTDAAMGRCVGSRLTLKGAVFGIQLFVEEEITKRDPPSEKRWRTIGTPSLLVIGSYEMGFSIAPHPLGSALCVFIQYRLSEGAVGRWLSRLLARPYARWCTRQMVQDARRYFERRT